MLDLIQKIQKLTIRELHYMAKALDLDDIAIPKSWNRSKIISWLTHEIEAGKDIILDYEAYGETSLRQPETGIMHQCIRGVAKSADGKAYFFHIYRTPDREPQGCAWLINANGECRSFEPTPGGGRLFMNLHCSGERDSLHIGLKDCGDDDYKELPIIEWWKEASYDSVYSHLLTLQECSLTGL